jgi:hypothetical protein
MPSAVGVIAATEQARSIPGIAVVVVPVAPRTRVPPAPAAGDVPIAVVIDVILEDVVVEASVTRQSLEQLRDICLGIARVVRDVDSVVVPIASGFDLVEAERIGRDGRVNPAFAGSADHERLTIPSTPNLVTPSRPNQVVVPGVNREDDPNPTVGVVIEDHQIAVVLGFDLDSSPLPFPEPFPVVDPELNGWSGRGRFGTDNFRIGNLDQRQRIGRRPECQHQTNRDYHMDLQETLLL